MISIDIPHLHHISFPYSQKSHTADNFLGNDFSLFFWLIECHQSTVQQSTSTWLILVWEILMIIQQHEKFSYSLSRGIWLILMIINEWWVEGWEARIQTITAACMRYLFLLISLSVLEAFFNNLLMNLMVCC